MQLTNPAAIVEEKRRPVGQENRGQLDHSHDPRIGFSARLEQRQQMRNGEEIADPASEVDQFEFTARAFRGDIEAGHRAERSGGRAGRYWDPCLQHSLLRERTVMPAGRRRPLHIRPRKAAGRQRAGVVRRQLRSRRRRDRRPPRHERRRKVDACQGHLRAGRSDELKGS